MRIVHALALTSLMAILAACNTVAGAGQDLQTGGEAITDSAQDAERGL
jgi:entericidin B